MTDTIALVLAAGKGTRLPGAVPKQYRDLGGAPVLHRTLRAFAEHARIDAVRVVYDPADGDLYARSTQGLALLDPVAGGRERQDSVRRGLESLEALTPKRVLIHDGARPFASGDLIDRMIAALDDAPAAIAAIPVTDTLWREADKAADTLVPRDKLWRAQTPQAFRYADIPAAHRKAAGLALTDDAAVARNAGLKVSLVMAAESNFKITTEEDLARASRDVARGDIRTGTGFDVHKFGAGDGVWLCGVNVPHEAGLDGHSDADVGLHALTDALLGAICEADIGAHFPPSDPQWRGASSDRFLAHAAKLIRTRGGEIRHVDVTLICERPKVGPHRDAMRARIAEILGIDISRVSVKATTTEGLGFTGRREGIAAQAAATVALP
ncbi:MAG: bifunctional 2-C-methyl-D-erythritol 4-phosphate cytidylyltransferase/2-C-methyl-D-erythritol 2,4-cyclodiphosphate synthase [Alphaproteobacteria bacterium]|nr:bifunctional 2-C-methyl-D-erythritol 4-phosphate cytidylyltransferase/2-C-methyl-D-erythritol 2,4-cyclodiphosphate synthase [Alphaproteobacteria bacterium]